jgi:hypothetical protein
MDIIEQIGAFAGLAAVLGLAVLSALYFSQARDVRRLREWAGRAPERVAEGAAADQLAQGVAAQPQPKVVQDAVSPAKPAAAAATGAGAAATKPGAATPAGATPAQPQPSATPAAKPTQPQPAGVPAGATPAPAGANSGRPVAAPGEAPKPGAPVPTPAAAQAATPAGAVAQGAPAQASAGTTAPPAPQAPAKQADGQKPGAPPVPSPPTPPKPPAAGPPKPPAAPQPPAARPQLPSRRGAPVASQTAILPPSQPTAPPWYRQLLASPRYLVLAIAGVLIVGGGAAFGIVQLTEDDSASPTADRAPGSGAPEAESDGPRPAPVNPADVTVSVLNGTTIPGLAASVGDRVEANGFVLGNVTNSAEQGEKAESVVLYAEGAEREAMAVGRRLGIAQRAPIDPESQALGGDATVVVITGNDLTQ